MAGVDPAIRLQDVVCHSVFPTYISFTISFFPFFFFKKKKKEKRKKKPYNP